ncbi:MAG: prephenate dehydrogenase [Planctomycetaceae bacterium]
MSGARHSLFRDDETIAIVGVGLIGGSIAAALKQRGHRGRIVGVGRNIDRLNAARQQGLIDAGFTSCEQAVADADLVVFCTPVDRIVQGAREAARSCRTGALLTDAGSVKAVLCRELDGSLPDGVTFIGSHPLAGSEKQGFEHADPKLFEGRVCVVTPNDSTPADQLDRLCGFWRSLGLTIVEMSVEAHDRALAQTSHLPHLAAAAIASLVDDENRPLAATGFRDTTRIAAGDPALWTAILLANAQEIIPNIDDLTDRLAEFREALSRGDEAQLHHLLNTAKINRDALETQRETPSTDH